MTFIFGKKDEDDISDENLMLYAQKQINDGLIPEEVRLGQLEGIKLGGHTWILRRGSFLVIVTANVNHKYDEISVIIKNMTMVNC